MRVIIAKDGKKITYENVSEIHDHGEFLTLLSGTYVEITLNGWLLAKTTVCTIEKKMLDCVDEVFLDTREDGV